MNAPKYEYQSEFARRYYGQGKTAGEAAGRLDIVLKLLTARYGAPSAAIIARVRDANASDLEKIAERILTAPTLDEALSAS
jgi:hypothetical protein